MPFQVERGPIMTTCEFLSKDCKNGFDSAPCLCLFVHYSDSPHLLLSNTTICVKTPLICFLLPSHEEEPKLAQWEVFCQLRWVKKTIKKQEYNKHARNNYHF
ncbi:hypothetical protein J1N35_030135 [Gossypium stocksii]|uniref:Uncharacterized protein n=1 Tax=Gossypium stocksii TaxID=47602 RepID=A0A9D3UZ60_9ROSI|nr:hypothetical protein J1N35_030135 [Gossypium stocksii]